MNSSSSLESTIFVKDSSTIMIESWLIPLDIVMITCIIVAITFSVMCLFLIIFDKTSRTVPMILIANSCLAEFLSGSGMLGTSIFILKNDLKQIQHQDSFCSFRAYFNYATVSIFNYSFLIQAFYRYVTVVYPTHLFWKSKRNHVLIICLTWIIGFIHPILAILTDEIIYDVNNQICQVSLRLSFTIIYLAHCIYIIPNSIIIFLYFKLVRYVRERSKRVTPANILSRDQRELQMVRRIVILVSILIILGVPCVIFLLMSFFTSIHKYHFRIAYVFVDLSLVVVIIVLFQFTEPLKASLMKRINKRTNMIIPAVT